jgi:acetyl esterase/lipase
MCAAIRLFSVFAVVLLPLAAAAQSIPPSAEWAARVATQYQTAPNVTYLTASNFESKLDIYYRSGSTPQPTVVFFHGGFWAAGAKEGSLTAMLARRRVR